MKNYLKLARVHHYIKNIFIFLPLFFSMNLFNASLFASCILGFVSFSLLTSVIYIINDLVDAPKDRLHPKKKNRPIASGAISPAKAKVFASVLFIVSVIFCLFSCSGNYLCAAFPALYFVFNLCYCFGGKNIPIVDIAILASGFLLRLLYGSVITNVEVSGWLYLTVLAISFYLGLGKRRNEIKLGKETRAVLKFYTYEYLDKMMQMFMAIAIVFYSLWCVADSTALRFSNHMIWTVPVVMLICMRYSLVVEGNSYGDPVDVILNDKILLLLGLLYALLLLVLMYLV